MSLFVLAPFKGARLAPSVIILALRPGVQASIINLNSPTFVWQFQSTVAEKKHFLSLLWFALNRWELFVAPLGQRAEACQSCRDKWGTNCINNGTSVDSLHHYQVTKGTLAKHLWGISHDSWLCNSREMIRNAGEHLIDPRSGAPN